jgi:hypothetical protein
MNAAQMFLACWILACHQVINAEELRAVHPELYDDETKLLQWNVERHVWKKSPRLEDGRRVNLWDVKAGPTLASWQREKRPNPDDCEEMKCERHSSKWKPEAVELRRSNVVEGEMVGGVRDTSRVFEPSSTYEEITFDKPPRVPVVEPMPVAYSESIPGETDAQFWQRWNATLSPTEKKELRPLSDFVMMKSRRPLTDDLPAVPDRRTKVTTRKHTKTELDATLSSIRDTHMGLAVVKCMESGRPYAMAKTVAEEQGLSYLALKQHIARARRSSVTSLRVSVEDCKERAA